MYNAYRTGQRAHSHGPVIVDMMMTGAGGGGSLQALFTNSVSHMN